MDEAQRQRYEAWEHHARWWQESFTDGADPEYEEQILPLAAAELEGARRVLDVGCGEGQVARRVAASGASVVGIEPSWSQVSEAGRRGGGVRCLRGLAAALPFRSGESFDAVVACLVFEHIDDLDGAMREVARVLEPNGRFVLFLNHPLLQTPGSAWVDDWVCDPPERYWRVGPYLDEVAYEEQVERGVSIRFVHRPLSRYVNAMAGHGLAVEKMIEPAPPPGFLARAPEYAEAAAIPRLLVIRSRKARSKRGASA